MSYMLVATALAGSSLEIADRDDARYLADTRRNDEAMAWYRARLESHPDDPNALVDYLATLAWDDDHRHRGLVGSVDAFVREHPTDLSPVARVLGLVASEIDPYSWTTGSPFVLAGPGPWCDQAREWLAEEPASPEVAYRIAKTRVDVERACQGDLEAARAQMGELAAAGAGGIEAEVRQALDDGADEGDLPLLERLFAERPLGMLATWDVFSDEATGDALDAARARVVEGAMQAATSERAALVWRAQRVLGWADEDEARRRALERVRELDPDNPVVDSTLGWMASEAEAEGAAEEEPPVDPSTILDPTARLSALREADPGSGWQRRAHFIALVETAEALGDAEALFEGAEALLADDNDAFGAPAFARAALISGSRTRKAERLMDELVESRRRGRSSRTRDAESRERWRRELAESLALRAEVRLARGDSAGALADLGAASALVEPTAEWRVRLGMLAEVEESTTLTLLAEGLAASPDLPPDVEEAAWTRVDEIIEARDLWVAGGAVALVEAHAPTGSDPAAPVDGPSFEEFAFTIDGEPATLDQIEGPVVVDLWATWCGPCIESLPHLDALARRYDGRFTMLAVSVDADEKTARDYLARRGDAAFTSAFAGPDAMDALGVQGIPAMFVFDAEHRLLETLGGYGAGNRSLDRAIERALSR